jgi:hypothetical protein
VTLAVTAGLLVAAAAPASASQTGPVIAPPQAEANAATFDAILTVEGFQGGCAIPTRDIAATESPKAQSRAIAASAGARLGYTLQHCMISGY